MGEYCSGQDAMAALCPRPPEHLVDTMGRYKIRERVPELRPKWTNEPKSTETFSVFVGKANLYEKLNGTTTADRTGTRGRSIQKD
jgi:hypothetical protein